MTWSGFMWLTIGCSERGVNGNEALGSIKGEKFLDKLNDY
jgi:hypothetical protein